MKNYCNFSELFSNKLKSKAAEAASKTSETTSKAAKLWRFNFLGFLDAWLPVFVEAGDVAIEERQAVGQPLLQDFYLFVIRLYAIGCKPTNHIATTKARELAHLELSHLGHLTHRELAHRWELAYLWHLTHLWESAKASKASRDGLVVGAEKLWVCLEMVVEAGSQQFGMTVDIGVDGLVAQH